MSGFTSGMKSSLSNEWTTPRELFDELNAEFHFTLDAASTDENALCEQHYTVDDDGLSQEWAGSVWLNPPYGREIGAWMQKAAQSNRGGGHCLPCSRSNRYAMVARMDCRPCNRSQVHSRTAQVWKLGQRRSVSFRNRHIRQAAEELLVS